MIRSFVVVIVCVCATLAALSAQSAPPAAAAGASNQMLLALVGHIEKQLTGVAAEMPEDRYTFAPTTGAFRGVRTFAEQLKHAAAANHLAAATLLDERVTADMAAERGPDDVKTKTQVLQYLGESFAALKRAAATVNDNNAFAPIKGPFGPATNSRVGAIVAALIHSSNHYGQLVEYLRLNGLVPPKVL